MIFKYHTYHKTKTYLPLHLYFSFCPTLGEYYNQLYQELKEAKLISFDTAEELVSSNVAFDNCYEHCLSYMRGFKKIPFGKLVRLLNEEEKKKTFISNNQWSFNSFICNTVGTAAASINYTYTIPVPINNFTGIVNYALGGQAAQQNNVPINAAPVNPAQIDNNIDPQNVPAAPINENNAFRYYNGRYHFNDM